MRIDGKRFKKFHPKDVFLEHIQKMWMTYSDSFYDKNDQMVVMLLREVENSRVEAFASRRSDHPIDLKGVQSIREEFRKLRSILGLPGSRGTPPTRQPKKGE